MKSRGAASRRSALIRSRFEAPGTVLVNRRLRSQEGRLKYELAFFIGHKVLHNGDGAISPHSAMHSGDGESSSSAAGMGAQDVLYAWRDFECSFLRALCYAHASRFADFDPRGAQRRRRPQTRRHRRPGHAPNDGGISVPALAFLRCLPTRFPAGGLSRQWNPTTVGEHELGVGSMPAMGGLPPAQGCP